MSSTATTDEALIAPTGTQAEQRFYPQLDGLRAVAVLLVLMYHMRDLALPNSAEYVTSMGWIGVDAFFVLSGFLITKILLKTEPGFRALGLFVVRRTLRTWPLYFAVLCAAWLTLRHTSTGEQINWLQYIFFLQNYTAQFAARTVDATWSLCVEEHFYLLWPLLLFLVPRRALPWLLLLIFGALPLGRYWGLHHGFIYKQLYTETQFHADGLVTGSFIAVLIALYADRQRELCWVAYTLLIVGVSATMIGFYKDLDVPYSRNVVFEFSSLAVGFAGLLLLLLLKEGSILAKVFGFGPLRYIGRISYGIYLLQQDVFPALAKVPLHQMLGGVADNWIFEIILRGGSTICIAALSYRFFESPILRLKNRLR